MQNVHEKVRVAAVSYLERFFVRYEVSLYDD